MKEPIDLNKKRVIPEVVYSVVEHLGWDSKDKKQRKIGTITQLQFLDLQDEMELVDKDHDKLKLIDEKTGELLLECKVGDKYHQLLLEIGLNTILERAIFEYESGGDFLEYVKNRPKQEWDSNSPNMQEWENNLDKEWTPLGEEE